MRHLYFSFITLSAALCFSKAAGQPHSHEDITAHLETFRADYGKSLLTANPEVISDYFSEEIRLMPEFQKTVLGKTNGIHYYQTFGNQIEVQSFVRTEKEILDLDAQVVEIGTFSMDVVIKTNGKRYELEGAYMDIWEIRSGKLTLLTQAWNYDRYYQGLDPYMRFEEASAEHIALRGNVPVRDNISFEIAALNRLLDATVTQHDAKVWSLFYADDAMIIPNHHPPSKGRKEIDAYLEMHVKELPVFEELDIRNNRIDFLGEYVIEYASHIASWRNGEASGVGLGKNIRIWRREPDHSLKIFRSIAMYD